MNESQRAMVAAKIATMSEGRPAETRPIGLVSQDDAADLLNVSARSVKRAKKVQESGDEKLIADVEAGKVTVSAAAQHVAAVTRYPELSVIRKPTYAHRLIDAADVVNNLLPIGNKLPTTESQTRELAPLDPELQKAVWQVAGHFKFNRRRLNLKWAHHAEVASLPPAEQDEWQDARHRKETHA